MRNNRNVTIRFLGRRWGHQQVQALLRAIGERGEVRVTCLGGQWYADVHCSDLHSVGHGPTMWMALVHCLGRTEVRGEC